MNRWKGRLEYQDLEGGVWLLHAGGEVYTLHGHTPDRDDLAGAEVEVEGEREDSFGFAMTGPTIAVKRLRKR